MLVRRKNVFLGARLGSGGQTDSPLVHVLGSPLVHFAGKIVRLFIFWGVRLFTLPATLGSPLVHVAGKNSPLVHIAGNIDKRTVAGHTKFTFTHHR